MSVRNAIGSNADAISFHSMERQAIINGNFDIWQRGITATYAGGFQYIADHWGLYATPNGGSLPTIVQTREELTPGDINGSFYFHRITVNGAGSSLGTSAASLFYQRIEYGNRYLMGDGKKVTVSFRARSSISNKKLGFNITVGYGTGGSPSSNEDINGDYVTLTSSWQNFTITVDMNTLVGKTFGTDNNDILQINFWHMWGSSFASRVNDTVAETFVGAGTIDIAQVQVCAGDIALPFEPKSYAEELQACLRYCNIIKSTGFNYERLSVGMVVDSTSVKIIAPFQVILRANPTISTSTTIGDFTIYSSNKLIPCSSAFINNGSNKYLLSLTATVASGLTGGDAALLCSTGTAIVWIMANAEI